MAGAQHRHGLAGIARPLAPRARRACRRRSADGRRSSPSAGRPSAPAGIGRKPRAGRVDHRIGLELLGPLAVLVADGEGLERPAVALHLVEADATDRRDAARGADAILERRARRQRLEVALHQLAARRILRRPPAQFQPRRPEQPLGRLVDVVLPRREHADMAPLAHRMRGLAAGLKHDRLEAAFQRMGGGSETDGPGARIGDGLLGLSGRRAWYSPIVLENSK